MDDDEKAALLRVRTLRRDGYRCRHREKPQEPMCGAFSRDVGKDADSNEYVALCPNHAPQEAVYVPTLSPPRTSPPRHRRRRY